MIAILAEQFEKHQAFSVRKCLPAGQAPALARLYEQSLERVLIKNARIFADAARPVAQNAVDQP
ncbi:MAG: hypothetical protein CMJ74_09995 [Planctomycetaceae bacterium]|nr:hypothetical protein [Planctomycetaceae bacterium]